MTAQRMNFSVDKFQLLSDSEDEQLSILKLWIVSPGQNLHEIPISWQAILDAKKSLIGKPILAAYDKLFDKLKGHESDENAIGVVLKEEDVFEEVDETGRQWLCAKAFLWNKYYPREVEVLRKNDGKASVSMEIQVLDGTDNGEGFESIELFSFMGVTILGTGIAPAIPGARTEVLKFSSLVKETEAIVNHRVGFSSGYRGIDFSIPSDVKSNSEKGLKLYADNKRGGNAYHLAIAKHITKSGSMQHERVKKLYASLKNKSKQDLSKNSDNHIAFMLMGGSECLSWCGELILKMESADNQSSHFTLNTGNGREMEETKLKKKFEEKEEGKEVEEKMAVEPNADEKPFAEEEEKKDEKPFAEEEKKDEKPFAEEEKKDEKPFAEEEKAEPAEEEEKMAAEEEVEKPAVEDGEEAKMSLDGYADVGAALTMLELETDKNQELATQYVSPEAGKQFSIMVDKIKELYAQNISLKEYRAGIEKKEFALIVESTLSDVMDVMPKEKLDECRLNSANFSLETISGWQNEVKALAYTFSKGVKEENVDGIRRFATATLFSNVEQTKPLSLWG